MQTEPSSQHETREQEQAWRDVIIDHSQFPRCTKAVDQPSHQGEGKNPFCGDEVSLSLRVGTDGLIKAAGIDIRGCAISTASASLMASLLTGMHIDQAQTLFRQVHALMTAEATHSAQSLGELEALSLVRQYPLRVKCASLAWHVLDSTLRGSGKLVSTE